MLKLLLRRLLLAVPLLWVVATFSFLLLKFVPGDPAQFILGMNATVEQVAKLHQVLGLDRPPVEQYLSWLSKAVRGDFGSSLVTGRSVLASVQRALPVTMSIALLSTLISLMLGLVGGMLAAIRKDGLLDRAVVGVAGVGLAIPNFWVAYVLILVFALQLRWFPATGYTPITQSFSGWLWTMTLPSIAIAISNTCQIMLQTRAAVLDTLSRDFVRTLQATGVRRIAILAKHVLRNAAIPVAVVTGISFIAVFSGVVVIEAIFNAPGMGQLLLNAVRANDFPVVQGAIVFFAILVMSVNLAVDIITGLLDPRARVA